MLMRLCRMNWVCLFAASVVLHSACSLALPTSDLSSGLGETDAATTVSDAGNASDGGLQDAAADASAELDAGSQEDAASSGDGATDSGPEGADAGPDPAVDAGDGSVDAGRDWITGPITGFKAKCLEVSDSGAAQLWTCDPARMQQ